MSDNTRQEAVERAQEALSALTRKDRRVYLAAKVIDASGLIEQLTEAIAQRDEARGHLATASEHLRSLFAQLAAERALCDRLADVLRIATSNFDRVPRSLADYDAHRAAERSEAEKGGPDGLD